MTNNFSHRLFVVKDSDVLSDSLRERQGVRLKFLLSVDSDNKYGSLLLP